MAPNTPVGNVCSLSFLRFFFSFLILLGGWKRVPMRRMQRTCGVRTHPDETTGNVSRLALAGMRAPPRRVHDNSGHRRHRHKVQSTTTQVASLPFFQNGATNLDLRCALHPAPSGSGCKTRLDSRINRFNRGSFMFGVSDTTALGMGVLTTPPSWPPTQKCAHTPSKWSAPHSAAT